MALRCPLGFEQAAWEGLDNKAKQILVENLPKVIEAQAKNVSNDSRPRARTYGKQVDAIANGAHHSADSSFVSTSSLLQINANGEKHIDVEQAAISGQCKVFFQSVVGSLVPLYNRINVVDKLVEKVHEKEVKCKEQIQKLKNELLNTINARSAEMMDEVDRGSTAILSMTNCTRDKLLSIAEVYSTAEEMCGTAIHTGDYSMFQQNFKALEQRFRSSQKHFDAICLEVERERKLVTLEVSQSATSDQFALSQNHVPQLGRVLVQGLGCILGSLDYDTLFHIVSLCAPTDITIFSQTMQWLQNLLLIDRFLHTEVALTKNFHRENNKGVSLKFSEAVARGLCHRFVGSEQAETMRAQMFDHPFNGAWKCLVTQIANPISEFGDMQSRGIKCTNTAEQRFVKGSGSDHAFAVSKKPIGDRVVWKFQVLTQLWVGCGIICMGDKKKKIHDRSYNHRSCYMFASSNQAYKDGTRSSVLGWGTFEEHDEALFCLDFNSATFFMYHITLGRLFRIEIDTDYAESIRKFHMHVNVYKDGNICITAPNMEERTLMLNEMRTDMEKNQRENVSDTNSAENNN